jgi:type III pantothenate kinase
MILCLDVGNTNIFGGLYNTKGELLLQFRHASSSPCTSDQLGIFFKMILHENNFDLKQIKSVSICSVVPTLNYSLRSAFLKYFALDPFFLQADTVPQLTTACKNPHEIGTDRISNAIAATWHYPDQNIIIVDMGTATTFDVISAERLYLGGAIIPGLYISMKALCENTEKLSPVNIVKPDSIIGQTTGSNIQSGLYYSHLGAAREIIRNISVSIFEEHSPVVIGTGGFAYLFTNDNIFNIIIPELVLQGLYLATTQNSLHS